MKKIFYLDQGLDKSINQDTICVVSLLELFFTSIIANFGDNFIKDVVVCSDNAGCYASNLLIAMIGILNNRFIGRMFISRLIHSETQDGKGLVDAHFAVSTRQLHLFITHSIRNKTRHIKTPRGLARALAWNNGVSNSIVQLVEIDREYMEKITKILTPVCQKLKKYFSRVSDIVFDLPAENEAERMNIQWDSRSDETLAVMTSCLIKFSAQSHSGYGNRIKFEINVNQNTVEPEEKGWDEYRRFLFVHHHEVEGEQVPVQTKQNKTKHCSTRRECEPSAGKLLFRE